ncbi:primosomal protein N' [Chloroflexota bacterium]
MAGYAEVSVNSPVGQRGTFSYAIPEDIIIEPGQAVWVPFGNKVLQGIVLELSALPAVERTREIMGIIDPLPVISRQQILLARWISEHYLSSLFNAVALMLPPGFERKAITFITEVPSQEETSSLTQVQEDIIKLVHQQGKISLKDLERRLGVRQTRLAISPLIRRGLVGRSYELEKIRVKPKTVACLHLEIDTELAQYEATRLRQQGKATRQAKLLELLSEESNPVLLSEARKKVNCSTSVVDALANKGFIGLEQVEVHREPISYDGLTQSFPLKLTTAQESVLDSIKSSLIKSGNSRPSPTATFLLHGVTGSGKTEIYLQALAEAIKLGKRGIILVPEIALTPQTIERFASRFPHKVAILHSKLSLGEQFDEWQRIRRGEFDVVIGPRSAIFAPQPDLGLIVIDEEYEWNYKQEDQSPRYHARDVAVKLAELSGAVIVLGSATPDVGTYYHAERGDYHLIELPERVTPTEGSPLPQVEVVDLREELKSGNRSIFSRSLSQAMTKAVNNGEQVILFINRRGASTFIQCRSCGLVLRCRRCETALTHHLTENILVCHQCNYKGSVPEVCPQCDSSRIKFLGTGTQRVEQEVGHILPQARLMRWDSDVTRGKNTHQEILNGFRAHEADILIGTQMVAKGLDLPLVTLVGVVNADSGLNLPDFRAGERTFQLLCQVIGRAGRGTLGGRVIVQSYCPDNYAVKTAASQDYNSFYVQEIAYRRQLRNPPFNHLVRLIYSHTNDDICQRETARMRRLLVNERDAKGIAGLDIIGPAPAFIQKLRGRFRWQIILRGSGPAGLLLQITFPKGWAIDVDPVGL